MNFDKLKNDIRESKPKRVILECNDGGINHIEFEYEERKRVQGTGRNYPCSYVEIAGKVFRFDTEEYDKSWNVKYAKGS